VALAVASHKQVGLPQAARSAERLHRADWFTKG
jgi:hypothetical protein